jgi:hypothetical protein
MHAPPLIAVRDVPASSRWYQAVLRELDGYVVIIASERGDLGAD